MKTLDKQAKKRIKNATIKSACAAVTTRSASSPSSTAPIHKRLKAKVTRKSEENSKKEKENQALSFPTPAAFQEAVRRGYEQDEFYAGLATDKEDPFYSWKSSLGVKLWWYVTTDDDSAPRLCVPNDPDLRNLIIREHHDTPYSGHPDALRTTKTLENIFYWPSMKTDVIKYVSECFECQKNKTLQRPYGKFSQIDQPTKPWTHVLIDFIEKLPKTKSHYTKIMVVQDVSSRMIILIPFKNGMNASDMADAYIEKVFCRGFGLPRMIWSDRDTRMTSDFWTSLFSKLGTSLHMSTAYSHTPHGAVENANKEIQKFLRFYVSPLQNDWDSHLKFAEFAFNNTFKTSTGHTPFELNGMSPRLPSALLAERISKQSKRTKIAKQKKHKNEKVNAENFLDSVALKLQNAHKILQTTTESRLERINRNRRDCPESFALGRKVWLRADHLSSRSQAKITDKIIPMRRKISQQYCGPFEIIGITGSKRFKLAIPPA